jgi:acetyltransferase
MNPDWLEVHNPIDTWMAALKHGLAQATVQMLGILLEDEGVDGVIILLNSYKVTGLEVLGKLIEDALAIAAARRDKPVVFWAFGANQATVVEQVEKHGTAVGFTSPDHMARALAGLHHYHSAIKGRAPELAPKLEGCCREVSADLLAKGSLLGAEALELVAGYGIATAPARLAADLQEAKSVAREIGYPVVLKVASPDLVHKSDVGGVALGIANPDMLGARHDALMTEVRRRAPNARIEGVWIQRFHRGVEVIVGARRHPGYGVVVVFGLGGIFTEVLRDVSFRLAPCTERDAREMIDELRCRALLQGARGTEVVDRNALEQAILRVSRLVSDFPSIVELDINPLVVSPSGALALDARVIVEG